VSEISQHTKKITIDVIIVHQADQEVAASHLRHNLKELSKV
jgi:hypothetical protein